MDREYSSVEILAWEDNARAIDRAMDVLKHRLKDAPVAVLQDVANRIDPEVHAPLAAWLRSQPGVSGEPKPRRVPKTHSPKHSLSVWMLYHAADLDCPSDPPNRRF